MVLKYDIRHTVTEHNIQAHLTPLFLQYAPKSPAPQKNQ